MTAHVRTPDDRFADLPDFAWEPAYVEIDGLRHARIDETGPAEGPLAGTTIVMLHGEPTWSFLWRHVAAPVIAAGARVVLPDLPGFGRSDKPTDRGWYSHAGLVEAFGAHLDAIGLDTPITLVVHDWGGLIGLTWAMANPDRVARLVIMDTALYVPGTTPGEAWQAFRSFVASADELPVGMLVQGAVATPMAPEVLAAYEAPFHVREAHAGPLSLPLLVPLADDDPGAAEMQEADVRLSTTWDRPTLVLWGGDDPIIPSAVGARWAATCPGSVGMEVFTPASHFLQEDVGEQLGMRIVAFHSS